MKRVKISLLVLMAVLGTISLFAFTAPKSTPVPTANAYFVYDGMGDVTDPESYQEVASLPSNCGNGQNICSILAPEDGNSGQPLISSQLAQRIEQRNTSGGDVFVKP